MGVGHLKIYSIYGGEIMNIESMSIGFLIGTCFGGAIGLMVAAAVGAMAGKALERERMRCRGFSAVLGDRRYK